MIEEELPVRREVEIRADNAAQLQLRLHGFERALALRSGYIMTVQQRSTATGQHIASISYELTLPEWLPKPRPGAAAPRSRHTRRPNSTNLGSPRPKHGPLPDHHSL
jgi:hypothetical protein